ncbi:regenerating islet-derived protein 3-gamma-like isoform X2 [Ochotona curzoniae]|uniref:regenerating islet-derived protein 3-gamma-like isoform X2 n=1 Tax=Ochotona curzoniae TaxID=130825 RepID=UPI001B3500FD|nr:regenerating islet-derived protein 3-gamma-like isoform X2 [Ochotona curzoniae]
MLFPMGLTRVSCMLVSCLMLLSQVQGEDSQKDVVSPKISCPSGSKVYGSYCYAVFVTPKSWTDAEGAEPNAEGWEWVSLDVTNYSAWERNPSTAANRGYCGSLSLSSTFLKWRDYNCNSQLPYICKFKD